MSTRILAVTKSLLCHDAFDKSQQRDLLLTWITKQRSASKRCLRRNYSHVLDSHPTCYVFSKTLAFSDIDPPRSIIAQTSTDGHHSRNRIGYSNSFQRLDRSSIRLMSTAKDDPEAPSEKELELRALFEPHEIKFKTPYGHVACLEWGKRDAPYKILCVHGWLDNAGSFERLVPYILDHNDNRNLYHVVAMDMPGVGHSSHRPASADYTTFSNVIEMRRVTTQLGWDNVTLLSHSFGAHISFLYSCIYPRQVESLISIDVVRPITFQADNWNVTISNAIENYFKCEDYQQEDPNTDAVVPVYTEEQALKRLMEAHSASLTRESAKVLMKRGARKVRDGYTFNRDIRHRHLSVEFRPDDELMMKYMERSFRPNLFVIRSTKSPFRRSEQMRLLFNEIFKKNCPMFRDKVLDGTHHLHMNTPGRVAVEINRFLDDVRSVASNPNGSNGNCDGTSGIAKANL